MNNLLLVFLDDLENIDEFNKIIDKFSKENYIMYLSDNLKDDEYFLIDSLPELVELYKKEHGDLNKVVVLSNLRDLIFCWFRCYNSVVDNFVYFIDKENNNYFDNRDEHYNFYKSLFNFSNIDNENISGKIYININFDNYIQEIEFLIKDNKFKYFDSFNEFEFNKKLDKKLELSKTYLFKGYEYNFNIISFKKNQYIRFDNKNEDRLNFDENFINDLIHNSYMIPFITVLFYKTKDQMLNNILLVTYRNLKGNDKAVQKYIFDKLYIYINSNLIDFKEKIYISSLIAMINNGDERLTELIMKTLLDDEKFIEYHYEIVVHILFYQSNENLNIHYEYYSNLRSEIEKLSRWIFRGLSIKKNNIQKNRKNIAIVVDQLLLLGHSPTKLILDYAKNIKKYYPEYLIKIFVEDNLYCSDSLGIIPNLYTSGISKSAEQCHKDYLNDQAIEIFYANVGLNKKDRTLEITSEIEKFKPETILTNSDISLVCRAFYNTYPIIYMSMGGDYFSNLADAYLCILKERVIEENVKYNLLDEERLYEFKTGLEFENPKREIKRNDYNIKENDFVLITVGNRLYAELDDEFVDSIVNFIESKEDVKWLIVGNIDSSYLLDKHIKLLNSKIINIKYESDLAALYRICDIYLNPRRKGGGVSVAMAMNEGLPIVLTKDSTDGVYYVGIDNATKNNMKDYINKLNILYLDIEERRGFGTLMHSNIVEFNYKNAIDTILNLI